MRHFCVAALLVLAVPAHSQVPPSIADIGPAIGSVVPPFQAVDQFGRTQTLQSVMGRDGLMLVFFRSADW